MAIRETGSILVNAPRDRVHAVIAERFLIEPGLHSVGNSRFESRRSTIVLQDAPGGSTRVVVAREKSGLPLAGRRDDLRNDVSGELLALQKLLEADPALPGA